MNHELTGLFFQFSFIVLPHKRKIYPISALFDLFDLFFFLLFSLLYSIRTRGRGEANIDVIFFFFKISTVLNIDSNHSIRPESVRKGGEGREDGDGDGGGDGGDWCWNTRFIRPVKSLC